MPVHWQCRCVLAFALLAAVGTAGWGQSDRAVSQGPPQRRAGGRAVGAPRTGPSDAGRTAVVTGLAWSPAGDRLCVAESRMQGEAGAGGTAVLLHLATGSRKEVALSGWLSPQGWSPDGKEISFLDPTGNVQVLDLDRDRARQVTSFSGTWPSARGGRAPTDWSPPAWSASGQWLAFRAFDDAWVVRPDGRGLRQLTQSGWTKVLHALGAGPGENRPGRRPATQGTAARAASSGGLSGGRGGGGGGGLPLSSPHPYAWSPGGNVLTYGQADAAQHDWSVQGYEAETGRVVSVRGDLGLMGIKALSWQPGGDQLAVVGVVSVGKQVVYLIPRQGALRALSAALTSVEVMWTGDGRTLLIRGATSGTQRLTVNAVEAEGGAVRTLPPTHFLADQEVIAAARPGSDDIAFALGASVYLAHADGSGWRRVQRAGRATVRHMANPLERWQRDPVVLAAARRWQRAIPRGHPDASPPDSVVYGIWDGFLARWKTRLLAGERISYRDLPEDVRREVLTGLVYQTFRNTSVGGDPAAIRVPGWYWWLAEARLGLREPEPSSLSLTLEGPNGDGAAFAISRPQPAGRRARGTILYLWWPALFGAAAIIVALLGWRQARRQRGTTDQSRSVR